MLSPVVDIARDDPAIALLLTVKSEERDEPVTLDQGAHNRQKVHSLVDVVLRVALDAFALDADDRFVLTSNRNRAVSIQPNRTSTQTKLSVGSP